jgi:hypothetical protein
VCFANAPAPHVPRFSCLFLIYIFRTKKRITPRKATTRIVTIAAIAPPETPLDALEASVLEAPVLAEGVAAANVGGTELLVAVVVVWALKVGVADDEVVETGDGVDDDDGVEDDVVVGAA